jgi:hypothetical protein
MRVGTSWRSGRGRRSWVSMPLWFLVLCYALGWPLMLMAAMAKLLWRAAVLAYLGLARAVRFTVALCRPDPAA